ncbi:hypothetical protein L227DRAFT_168532 [Lentinus tigrinus ALCF2SS1-6]|uniref:F-box domain-containing protein n=1 Tax=Lentinus tigrinus ALCF2SS1-6 TaxID=1328759 RepID=A0A5C2S849_9APHY|nr:hypothetical protein L227DRAFT_168532 [Lentinus tigrinus ALCF2SS1-6]
MTKLCILCSERTYHRAGSPYRIVIARSHAFLFSCKKGFILQAQSRPIFHCNIDWELMDYHSTYGVNEDIPTFTPHLTTSDKAYLSQIDLCQVQEWTAGRIHRLRARIDEINKRISSLSSVYNAAAPINRTLPVEIPKEIFANLTPSKFPGHSFKVLGICRLWRHLILHKPEYWADVLTRRTNHRSMWWPLDMARNQFFLDLAREHTGNPSSFAYSGNDHEMVS